MKNCSIFFTRFDRPLFAALIPLSLLHSQRKEYVTPILFFASTVFSILSRPAAESISPTFAVEAHELV